MRQFALILSLWMIPLPAPAMTGADLTGYVAAALAEADLPTVQVLVAPERRFPACPEGALQVAPGASGWNTVTVSCQMGAGGWTRHLRTTASTVVDAAPRRAAAGVASSGQAVVLRHALARGHVLTLADLDTATRPASAAARFDDPLALVGRRLAQPLDAGQTLSPRHLEADWMVRRGERLYLTYRAGPIEVTSPVMALSDGQQGDTIEVQNPGSSRRIAVLVQGRGEIIALSNISRNAAD